MSSSFSPYICLSLLRSCFVKTLDALARDWQDNGGMSSRESLFEFDRRSVFETWLATGRHGHNELDDPQATLPLTYACIQAHPCVLDIYADRLQHRGLIPPTLLDSLKVSPRTT